MRTIILAGIIQQKYQVVFEEARHDPFLLLYSDSSSIKNMTGHPSSVTADDAAPTTEKNTEANISPPASTRDQPSCWIYRGCCEYTYLAQQTRNVSCNAEAIVTNERVKIKKKDFEL